MGIQTVVQCGGFQRQDDGENVRCVVENMRAGCVCDVNDTTSWPGLYSHFHEMQIANITCSLTHSLALAHILLSFRLYCRKRGLVLCSNIRRCVVESSTVQQFLSLALAASSYLLSMYCYALHHYESYTINYNCLKYFMYLHQACQTYRDGNAYRNIARLFWALKYYVLPRFFEICRSNIFKHVFSEF